MKHLHKTPSTEYSSSPPILIIFRDCCIKHTPYKTVHLNFSILYECQWMEHCGRSHLHLSSLQPPSSVLSSSCPPSPLSISLPHALPLPPLPPAASLPCRSLTATPGNYKLVHNNNRRVSPSISLSGLSAVRRGSG